MADEIYYPQLLGEPTLTDKTNLGDGFSIQIDGEVQKALIFDADATFHEENQVKSEGKYSFIRDSTDMSEALDIGGTASLKYKFLSGGGSVDFDKDIASEENTVNIFYRKNVTLKTLAVPENEVGVIANPRIVGKGAKDILKLLGSHYISKVLYGAALEIDFKWTASDKETVEKLKASGNLKLDLANLIKGEAEIEVDVSESTTERNSSLQITTRVLGNTEVANMPSSSFEEIEKVIAAFKPKITDPDLAVVGYQVRPLPLTLFPTLVESEFNGRRYEVNVSEAAEIFDQVEWCKRLSKGVITRFEKMLSNHPARPWKSRFMQAAESIVKRASKLTLVADYLRLSREEIVQESIHTYVKRRDLEKSDSESIFFNYLQNLVREVHYLTGVGSIDINDGGYYDGYALRAVGAAFDSELIPEYHGLLEATLDPEVFTFEGKFNAGEFSSGRVVYRNGDVYEGRFLAKKPHGKGRMDYGEDQEYYMSYDGNWHGGDFNGLGTLVLKERGVKRLQGGFKYPDFVQLSGEFLSGDFIDGEVLYRNEDVYLGEFFNKKPHGEGTMMYRSGGGEYVIYTGGWNIGLFNGNGTLEWKEQNEFVSFKGTFEGGHFVHGDVVYRNGNMYKGDFSANMPDGEGLMMYSSEDENYLIYEGKWEMGLFHGIGTLTWNDRSEFVSFMGMFEQGEFAQGKVVYRNGDTYEGPFSANKPQGGMGTMIYSSEDENYVMYEGDWDMGLFHGFGKLEWNDRSEFVSFTGMFEQGEFTQGKVVYRNGDTYEGPFLENMPEGIGGTMIYSSEDKNYMMYSGNWKMGQFHERGKLDWNIRSQFASYTGMFDQGEFTEGKVVYRNGNEYSGDFSANMPHGEGSMTYGREDEKWGTTLDGKWDNGEYLGP